MGRLSDALKALFGSNKTTGTYVPLVKSNGTPDGNMSMRNIASVLGVLLFSGGGSEADYPDLNDLRYGCFYSGSTHVSDGTWSNYPTSIVNSSNYQICVIAIAASWGGGARGFQIAFSRLGMAIRFNAGTWGAWTERLWSNWPQS